MAINYDVRIRPINNPSGKTVAFAQLIIDNAIEIDGFKIINGSKGLFVAPPQHKGKDKEGNDAYYDDVRFPGEKPEGVSRTEVQDSIYKLMVERYQQASATSNRGAAAVAQSATMSSGDGNRLWGSV